MTRDRRRYRGLVIGASAGGRDPLVTILSGLPADFALPVVVVQHLHPTDRGAYAEQLDACVPLHVHDADDKQELVPAHVYTAPANYHLLIEGPDSLALSADDPVNWCRPSVDVLFESAVYAWGSAVIGVVLSGGGSDGAAGLAAIGERGGATLVQDPATAEVDSMPRMAIAKARVQHVRSSQDIAGLLCELAQLVTREELGA